MRYSSGLCKDPILTQCSSVCINTRTVSNKASPSTLSLKEPLCDFSFSLCPRPGRQSPAVHSELPEGEDQRRAAAKDLSPGPGGSGHESHRTPGAHLGGCRPALCSGQYENWG